MFHFRFDLEDGVDEATCAQDMHEAPDYLASTLQQNGEPFSEIDLDSLVSIEYPLHPHMHPHPHESSLAGSITDSNILLIHLYPIA